MKAMHVSSFDTSKAFNARVIQYAKCMRPVRARLSPHHVPPKPQVQQELKCMQRACSAAVATKGTSAACIAVQAVHEGPGPVLLLLIIINTNHVLYDDEQ